MYDAVTTEETLQEAEIVTVHAAIAVGSVRGFSRGREAKWQTVALAHYQIASSHAHQLNAAKPTGLGFKAMLTLVQAPYLYLRGQFTDYACQLVASIFLVASDTDSLLATTCHLATTLGLENRSNYEKYCCNAQEEELLAKAFWLFYCVEKQHRKESGRTSVCSYDCVTHVSATKSQA